MILARILRLVCNAHCFPKCLCYYHFFSCEANVGLKDMGSGVYSGIWPGGGLKFFSFQGAQHPLGMHENPLNSKDFTCPGREGVQSSSNSSHRHPNLFCSKRAPQLVISSRGLSPHSPTTWIRLWILWIGWSLSYKVICVITLIKLTLKFNNERSANKNLFSFFFFLGNWEWTWRLNFKFLEWDNYNPFNMLCYNPTFQYFWSFKG